MTAGAHRWLERRNGDDTAWRSRIPRQMRCAVGWGRHLKGASALDQARLGRLLDALHVTDNAARVLHRLCTACVAEVGVDGAALCGVTDGEPRVLDASDADTAIISSLQFEMGEGPCLDALASFHLTAQPNLAGSDAYRKWPAFAL